MESNSEPGPAGPVDKAGDVETARLGEAVSFVNAQTRLPWATLALIIVMAGLYFLAVMCGGSGDSLVLLLLVSGAKINSSVAGGEWWRLLASAFLHGSFTHLVANAIGILLLGWFLENAMGKRFLLVSFVLPAVVGSIVSVFATNFPSVGASGGMLGLMGATVGFAVLRWRRIPRLVRSYVIGLPLAVGVSSIIHGMLETNVDNFAHVGGAIAGLFLGLAGVFVQGRATEVMRFLGKLGVAAILLVTVYSTGSSVARMFFRFELPEVEWAVRGEGERRVHLWPVNWRAGTLVEGVCLLGEPVTGSPVTCYADPYFATLVVGKLQRMRGTGIYAEWSRRTAVDEVENDGIYGPYDILWYEDVERDLAFGLLAYAPIVDKYVPAFTAFRSRPESARAGRATPGGQGRQ
jgi:membrane associated rhomboid family serine protease